MHSLVQPNAWVALKLPSGDTKTLQVVPNTTVSLGKYGSFPSNLIIQRPYHLTYELLDRKDDESFNRLRIVPASELYSDILSSTSSSNTAGTSTPAPEDEDADTATPTGVEYSLVDPDSGVVVAKTDRAQLDVSARQTLGMEEIEQLKKDGTDAGKDLIAKLMLSHTALDQKTQYALAKYKLLKTRKYIRRFCVLPLDVPMLGNWLLEEKDSSKILDMREEMVALLGCWANVHFGGKDRCENDEPARDQENPNNDEDIKTEPDSESGRWLVVDDTGGLLVAALAERMGVLYPDETEDGVESENQRPVSPQAKRKAPAVSQSEANTKEDAEGLQAPQADREGPKQLEPQESGEQAEIIKPTGNQDHSPNKKRPAGSKRGHHHHHHHRHDDMHVPYARTNTLTLLHANSQPNLSYLRYFGFDHTNPSPPLSHPLSRHLTSVSWLQLLEPSSDSAYAALPPPEATPEELRSWKANRRGTYHRKRRRWARVRHAVDAARAGGFAGLVVAAAAGMDPISVLRHAVPLLRGGAPVAVYSQTVEPLAALADCYSIARRAAWAADPPPLAEVEVKVAAEAEGEGENNGERKEKVVPDRERAAWPGSDEFPLNPSLLLGAAIQTSRVRRWQVLPGRTHPLMTSRGGPEGYVFTAWRVKPAEGKVEARGKARPKAKKRKVEAEGDAGTGVET
ncbi:tRNA (adenine(58)-N(1))-methyltransferase non-catalytic subunit trm6 [Diatrype stigma]|uniref:tRNA (adenine(58)-N(1))-methyltransferase non-catalytic subunit TRM6 n=1 Tax=Diatrype stigma TaxID=117547 RepID=A0AAN9YS73_9PEZI